MVDPIIVQIRRNEEEVMGLSGKYLRQGYPILNVFPDTGKPPASVFCDHLFDNPGNLSSSGGVCTTPYIDSIEFNT